MLLHWSAFQLALSFLTRLPLGVITLVDEPRVKTLSTQYYIIVGFVVGLILVASIGALQLINSGMPADLQALLLLLVWVGVTGALHLDGLADCIDGASVAHKSKDKIQQVMHEPSVGAMAVVGLSLYLLAKFVLIKSLLLQSSVLPILLAPALARWSAVLYMRTTDYRGAGLAEGLIDPHHDGLLAIQSLALVFFLFFSLGLFASLLLILCLAVFYFAWRMRWIKLIGGFNGDCVGAGIEIAELLVLLLLVSLQ